jgi:hypothetical protein
MHQSGASRLWRRLAAGFAAYVIALQAAFSGMALATIATPSNALTAPICSAHAADPANGPSRPASDPGLCPCAPGCITACGALSDAPTVAVFAPSAGRGPAVPKLTVHGPQIPRAPPTI